LTKINFEKIIKAKRDKVFDIITNFEEFQNTLPEFFPSIRVRSIRDNVAVVEEHVKLSGKELVIMAKHVTQYPEVHEVFVIGGDAKGSHIIERFEKIEEGTKITVDGDIKLKTSLRITGFSSKEKITIGFSKIIDGFAKIVETQSD